MMLAFRPSLLAMSFSGESRPLWVLTIDRRGVFLTFGFDAYIHEPKVVPEHKAMLMARFRSSTHRSVEIVHGLGEPVGHSFHNTETREN
jgi:hypothetical protein